MKSLAERVEVVYRHLHPHKPSARGAQAWFRRELSNRAALDVSPKTVHLWLRDGVPVDRLPAVRDTLIELEAEATTRLEAAMAEIGP